MHPNFANWYRSVSFGNNPETLAHRWTGVESVAKDVDFALISNLVKTVFNATDVSADFSDSFRQNFKSVDDSFLMQGNESEVRVLCACVLAVLCSKDDEDWGEDASLAILTASLANVRKLDFDFDLIGIALDRVNKDGINARVRPEAASVKQLPKATRDSMAEAIKSIKDAAPTPALLAAVFEPLNRLVTAISTSIEQSENELTKLQNHLVLQDEELHVLWWLVGGRSFMWDENFKDIDESALPIMLAAELAAMTEECSEPPSLKAIFSRVGIRTNAELLITEAITQCGEEALKSMNKKSQSCPTIYPLHSAMFRALELGVDDVWIKAWHKISGIPEGQKLSPVGYGSSGTSRSETHVFELLKLKPPRKYG